MKASVCSYRARVISSQMLRLVLVIVLSVTVLSTTGKAQTTVGGHIGFVLPLVTWAGGQTTNLTDNFSIGFPAGITVKGTGRMAFDLEFISSVQDSPRDVSLTVHPGFLWNVGHGFAPGIRAAFVVNSPEYGFTPLLNKGWPIKSKGSLFKAYFVEADLPVRFNRPVGGPSTDPVTFAMHFGLGF
ncbi:MAG: hypothetical protein ABSD59_17805 [Terracidiphilus sp.]|jgi:hypothetical protein